MMREGIGEVGNFSPCNGRARSRCGAPESKNGRRTRSGLAVMPQVDHRVGEGFEGVVQLTDALKAKQQTPELIFPGKQPLDGTEPFFEDGWIEQRLSTSLGMLSAAWVWIDVGNHFTIEDGFAIVRAVVHTIQAHDAAMQVQSERACGFCQ